MQTETAMTNNREKEHIINGWASDIYTLAQQIEFAQGDDRDKAAERFEKIVDMAHRGVEVARTYVEEVSALD